MSKRTLALVLGLAATSASAPVAAAQEATEVFIPIGKSPGVSKQETFIGTVDAADEKGRSLRVTAPAGAITVAVTDKTRIFRDKSALKQRNEVGTFADLQKGRTVEVKLEPGEGQRKAEWIKVRITEAAVP
jgi:ABC-type sugar transport system substrate-binding protein